MLISTTESITGHEVTEVLGMTFGVVVRARGLGGDIMASLKSLVGGEITRRQALDRMVDNAHKMGADAIVMMRFDSGDIGQNMSEIIAYGTAVKIRQTT